MAVNYLQKFRKKAYNHLLAFAGQTTLHGPKYFLNRGEIEGGKEIKRRTGVENKIHIKVSRLDR